MLISWCWFWWWWRADSCVYGDYRGLYDINGRKLSCSQVGSQEPHKCYQKNIADDCCQTCPSIRRTDIAGDLLVTHLLIILINRYISAALIISAMW